MNARKYEVLTRAFFLTAIVSSMLYGKLGSLNWIAMGIGIAAAAGAAATYFYNAYSSDKPREEAAPQISKEALVQVVLAEAHEMRVDSRCADGGSRAEERISGNPLAGELA